MYIIERMTLIERDNAGLDGMEWHTHAWQIINEHGRVMDHSLTYEEAMDNCKQLELEEQWFQEDLEDYYNEMGI